VRFLIHCHITIAVTLLVGRQEEHPAWKKLSDTYVHRVFVKRMKYKSHGLSYNRIQTNAFSVCAWKQEMSGLAVTVHVVDHNTVGDRWPWSFYLRISNTTTVLWPFFQDHPGEPVPEENFWTVWCKRRSTEADTLTIRLRTTPSGLTSDHLHHPTVRIGNNNNTVFI